MADLRDMAGEIGRLSQTIASRYTRGRLFNKIGLLAGGATLAAVAQGVELAHANHEISAWTIAGLGGAVLVGLGAVFDVLTETGAPEIVEAARKAVEQARGLEVQFLQARSEREFLDKEVKRGLELYNSMFVMRGAIEESLALPGIGAPKIIQTCLSAAINSLVVAFDFATGDTWTICVYEAQKVCGESGRIILRCVAHERKVTCAIEEARSWPEGVGVAGIAYSMRSETTIPDVLAPELGTVFKLKINSRPNDDERHRSLVAVPISIGPSDTPWGVAVVSTATPYHFNTEPSEGVSTSEPIRAIAAMAALAVKAAASSPGEAAHSVSSQGGPYLASEQGREPATDEVCGSS